MEDSRASSAVAAWSPGKKKYYGLQITGSHYEQQLFYME